MNKFISSSLKGLSTLRNTQQQSGFSLVELMISVGITSVSALALMSITVAAQKNLRQLEDRFDFLQTTILVNQSIASTLSCTPNFVDKVFDSNPASIDSQAISVDSLRSGAVGNILARTTDSAVAGGLLVDEIKLSELAELEPDSYSALLHLTPHKKIGYIAPTESRIGIRLTTTSAPGGGSSKKIVSCAGIDSSLSGGCSGMLTQANLTKCLDQKEIVLKNSAGANYLCAHQQYSVPSQYTDTKIRLVKNAQNQLEVHALNYPHGGVDAGAWTCVGSRRINTILCTLNDQGICTYSRAGFGGGAQNANYRVSVDAGGLDIVQTLCTGRNVGCEGTRSAGLWLN